MDMVYFTHIYYFCNTLGSILESRESMDPSTMFQNPRRPYHINFSLWNLLMTLAMILTHEKWVCTFKAFKSSI